jgi:hypothetical protein
MLRNEYLVAENRILRDQIKGRLQLSDAERQTLAEIGQKLGKQALEEVANIVKPDTITDRKCKRHDTVGELRSAEIFASHMSSKQAKKLDQLA